MMENIQLISNPWFYAVTIPAILSIGISKAGVGGTGSIAMPLMSLAIGVPQAAAILLPIICLIDIFAVLAFRKSWDKPNLLIMIPGATIGIVIGAITFKFLDPAAIKLMIGIIAVWFSGIYVVAYLRKRPPPPAHGPKIIKGGFWMSVTGFTSFVAHSGGPPLNVYMIPQRLDKSVYMGTLAFFYAYVNYAKIGPYWWLGQFDATNLATSAMLLPVAPVGIVVGLWIHRRINEVIFYRAVLTLLFITGIKLCYDGAMGLLANF